jgi:hypothetical protein
VRQGLPVEGLGENGEGRWRAAHEGSNSGERRLKFRRSRLGNGTGAWSRGSRARRGSDSATPLEERKAGRGSSAWSRGGGNGGGAAAVDPRTGASRAALDRLPGSARVRREATLRLGAAT